MNRIGAWCGFLGVAGNVLGVAVLGPIPSAYRPGPLPSWVREVIAAPDAAAASAVAFTIGLLALAGWALIVGSRLQSPIARAGGVMIAIGAVLDAAATPSQLVVAIHMGPLCRAGADCLPAGVAILGTSLALDALFNLLLGLGLIAMSVTLWRLQRAWRWLGPLALVAGLASVPVGLQVYSDQAARLLGIAAPFWLTFVCASSVGLWRDRL